MPVHTSNCMPVLCIVQHEDVDPACQKVLKELTNSHGFRRPHVFLDLFDLVGGVASGLSGMPIRGLTQQLSLAPLVSSAFCCGHGLYCPLPRPDMDVTGTPCQYFSAVGSRQGLSGPQMHFFLVWCRIILALAVPIGS